MVNSCDYSNIGSGTFEVPFWPRYVNLCVLVIEQTWCRVLLSTSRNQKNSKKLGTFTRKYSCYSVLAEVSQIVSALIDALTGPESNLYARKMIPSILTSNSDHTRSRLHGKHHIRFLDSFRLYNIVPKSSWVTIRSSLCFELEQIRDHFYYTNFKFFYNKSGLRFALAQSIANFLL